MVYTVDVLPRNTSTVTEFLLLQLTFGVEATFPWHPQTLIAMNPDLLRSLLNFINER